ncbi:MAG TPA: RHS repeat-associated core domain-containing protein [Chlamydiales bacterium]|nr:RHS repeat-associated core domain-containing protein [Chlamydiales bacterium]
MKQLLIFFFAFALYAEEQALFFDSSAIATLANDPSSLIDGKLSAITGQPALFSIDLTIQGKQPIPLTRYYTEKEGWNLAWDFAKADEMPDSSYRWIIQERGEGPLVYKKEGSVKIDGEKWTRYTPSKLNKGTSNTAKGEISSRTNPFNHQLFFDEKYKHLTITRADGTIRHYKKTRKSKNEYKLLSEKLPNGNWILYEYHEIENDKKEITTLLSKIYTTNPTKTKTYASAKFHYLSLAHPNRFQILGSDGQTLCYAKDPKEGKLIEAISSTSPKIRFSYANEKIHKILFPLDREWKFQRFETGPSTGRVQTLYSATSPTHTLSYEGKQSRYNVTSVLDAENCLTEYLYGSDLRLWQVKRYSKEQLLLQTEECVWGDEKLQWRALRDAKNHVIHSKRYIYDAIGNLLEERFYGNLSGNGPQIVLNHLGEPIYCGECFTKRYRYSESAPSLLLEEWDDTGKKIIYTYLHGTDLLSSIHTYSHEECILRQFFTYDEDHILIEEIEDDGKGLQKEDLSRVAVRTIRRITPLQEGPYLGMPETIVDLYLEKGEEHLLKKTHLSYTTGGKILRKQVFDSDGKFQFHLQWLYDEKGRLIEEIDALGRSRKIHYDLLNNPSLEQLKNERCQIETSYDLHNRKIKETLLGIDAIHLTSSFIYNGRGELVEEIDPRNNRTTHLYNALGKRSQTTLPPTCNEGGFLIPSLFRTEFDAAGNASVKTDSLGRVTKITYNSYGKPILILHPDGAKEEFSYYLNGALKAHTDPIGVTTSFLYDGLERVLRKTILAKGKIISQESFRYQGKRLIESINPEGIKTSFFYDGAGRKIREECAGEIISFQYDSLSRVTSQKLGDIRTEMKFDVAGQLIEKRKEVTTGNLLELTRYTYDRSGNCIQKIQDGAVTAFLYDSLDRLIETIDPLGASSKTIYEDQFTNSNFIQVCRKKEIDPLNLERIEVFDAQHHLVKVETWKGRLLALQERGVNEQGELTHVLDIAFSPEGERRIFHTEWEYDERGRVKKEIRAAKTDEAKTTSYTYTPRGELAKKILPDGTTLTHQYNELGFLISLTSSDFTVFHKMEYDLLGRCTLLDGIHRSYNEKGMLLEERFPHFTLENCYDSIGRRKECRIDAADCLIAYTYEGDRIKEITRKNKNEIPLYTHTCLAYNSFGEPLREKLAGEQGELLSTYDVMGRCTQKKAPLFSQNIEQLDPLGHIHNMELQGRLLHFQYDDLYQLTREEEETYAYDSLYNRVRKGNIDYKLNASNELTSLLTYDLNGNPTQQGELFYSFDALGRLLSVKGPDWAVFYTYDPLHRRLSSKIRTKEGEKILYFLYDGMHEIGAFDSTFQIQELRILKGTPRAEIGAAIAIELGSKCYAPIHDLQGNVALLLPLSSSNSPISFSYSAFGEKEEGSVPSPWGFSSKREDEKTGFVYFGRRYYMPNLGRWLTPDPLGNSDGPNVYAYVHNNPLTHFDLFGLADFDGQKEWTYRSPSYTPTDGTELNPYAQSWWKTFDSSFPTQPKYSPHYYINGIGNSYSDHLEGAKGLQSALGNEANVIPHHSESFGWPQDIRSVFQSQHLFYSHQGIEKLRLALQLEIACMEIQEDPRKLFITCFSRGATDVWHAVKDFSQEKKDRLIITACGPTMLLPRDLGFSVTNLISRGDWCSRFITKEILHFGHPHADVVHLPSANGHIPFHPEHYFLNKTYQQGLRNHTKPLYEEYGAPLR